MSEMVLSQPIPSVGDNALISAYLGGDERAFEVLVSRYQDKLVNYLNTLIHDYDMALDLSQEAFIRVYRNARRYRGEYRFSTWLYRIATNLAIDEMRRRGRRGRFFFHNVVDWFHADRGSVTLPDSRQSPEQSLYEKEQILRLTRAIDSLPQKYRLSFILKEVQELSYEEAGQVLGASVGTVKSRVYRAKKLLREKLIPLS